jgi:F0F1-type ATP synthase alpha subunit
MDDVAVGDVNRFKAELLTYVRTSHPEVEKAITSTGVLDDATTQKIKDLVSTFKTSLFQASK